MTRSLLLLALTLAVPVAGAQPAPQVPGWGFAWERVGDFPPNPGRYINLGRDNRIWVTGIDGIAELHEAPGTPGTWRRYRVQTADHVLVRGDTVWYSSEGTFGGGGIGIKFPGEPWTYWPTTVTDAPGGGFIIEGPPNSTAPGRFFTSSRGSVGYSDGRGLTGTWTNAGVVPNPENTTTTYADDIALFPAPAYGGAYPGRVLLAGNWGVAISDDRGTSWRISDLWQYLVQAPRLITTLARPGGGTRAVTFGKRNGETCGCTRVWTSEDGGETWAETAQLNGPGLTTPVEVVSLPGAGQAYDLPSYDTQEAIVLLRNGLLWRTGDGGATWANVGQVPLDYAEDKPQDLFLAPDRRLYVSTQAFQQSVDSAWVWRTSEPLPVAPAPAAVPSEVGVTVRPNPSSGAASVTVGVRDGATHATVEVFDAVGRRVAFLHDGPLVPGTRAFEVDVGVWPSGAYVVRVTADGQTGAGPLTVVR